MSLYDAKNLKLVIKAIEITSEELATNANNLQIKDFYSGSNHFTEQVRAIRNLRIIDDPLSNLVTEIKEFGSNYLDAKNLNLYNDASNLNDPLYKLINQWVESAVVTYKKPQEFIEAKVNIYINKIAKTSKLTKGISIAYASAIAIAGLLFIGNSIQINNLENQINQNKLRVNDLTHQEKVLEQQRDKITDSLPTVSKTVELPRKKGLRGVWQRFTGRVEYTNITEIDPKAITPNIEQQLNVVQNQLKTIYKEREELAESLELNSQKSNLSSANFLIIMLAVSSGFGAYFFLPRNGYFYKGDCLKIKL
jgi:hypothetical protein